MYNLYRQGGMNENVVEETCDVIQGKCKVPITAKRHAKQGEAAKGKQVDASRSESKSTEKKGTSCVLC